MANSINILIVVDVQNCFIAGGTLGIDKDKIKESYTQIKEIEELIDTTEHIYFTRDFHPLNHSSLTGEAEKKKRLIILIYFQIIVEIIQIIV